MRTLAHISDLHFDYVDPIVAEALRADLLSLRPDLLVISGDFTQRARSYQFRDAMDFVNSLPSQKLIIAGNHDVPLFNLARRIFWPLGRFRKMVSDDPLPIYRDDEVMVVGINTAGRGSLRWNGFWKDGRVDLRLLDRAIEAYRQAGPGVVKIAVTHHPFVAHDEKHAGDTVRNGEVVLKRLAEVGVQLLIAGHLHRAYQKMTSAGVLSAQAGTACSTRRRGEPNSYNVITINGGRYDVCTRRFNGRNFQVES